ncbi:MAG: NADPH-dependent F420 reductase [Actinomycetota bacterium]
MARIGFIGAGHVGGALARHFAAAGHEVAVSNSRGPETLADLVAELGAGARAVTPAEAAAFGDVVVVSVPMHAYREVPTQGLEGKPVIDTNNYYPQRDGQIAVLDDDSKTSSELLAAHLGTAHVVKAFNQIASANLASEGKPAGTPERTAIPIAGDDAGAKASVAALIDEIGFDTVDIGVLADSRIFQPGAPLYVHVTADEAQAIIAAHN